MLRARPEVRLLEGQEARRPVAVDQGAAMIAIFDYGAGNLRSVENTLAEVGAAYDTGAQRGAGCAPLRRSSCRASATSGRSCGRSMRCSVREAFLERITAGVPFLGICLGLHALFDGSEEAPGMRGLGSCDRHGPPLSGNGAGCRTWVGTAWRRGIRRGCWPG